MLRQGNPEGFRKILRDIPRYADPRNGLFIQRGIAGSAFQQGTGHRGGIVRRYLPGIDGIGGSERGAVRPGETGQKAVAEGECIHLQRAGAIPCHGTGGISTTGGQNPDACHQRNQVAIHVHDIIAKCHIRRGVEGITVRQGGQFFQDHRLGGVLAGINRSIVNGFQHAPGTAGGAGIQVERGWLLPQADGEGARQRRGGGRGLQGGCGCRGGGSGQRGGSLAGGKQQSRRQEQVHKEGGFQAHGFHFSIPSMGDRGIITHRKPILVEGMGRIPAGKKIPRLGWRGKNANGSLTACRAGGGRVHPADHRPGS